ncbi:MAG: hypothetical protein R3B96_04670 [Pirellulaceae bacterium]
MTIRVNDEDTRLSLKQVTCDQDCIEVEMEPINGAEGLYRLTVRVPEDRPDGAHAGTEAANLKLESRSSARGASWSCGCPMWLCPDWGKLDSFPVRGKVKNLEPCQSRPSSTALRAFSRKSGRCRRKRS